MEQWTSELHDPDRCQILTLSASKQIKTVVTFGCINSKETKEKLKKEDSMGDVRSFGVHRSVSLKC